MKKLFFSLTFFLLSCGHSSTLLQEDTSDPVPTAANPSGSVSPATTDCRNFIQNVVSFTPGPGAGFGNNSFPEIVFGPPEGDGTSQGGFDVLSLGDHGQIVVDMGSCRISDGDGTDFIIFENAFNVGGIADHPFAEPAVVSVSEDGQNFASFSCLSDHYPYTGCAGWRPVLSNSQNHISPFDPALAGGDPFDLKDIGVQKVRYIKIEDVSNGGFPPSKGFDLDAIAIVHGTTQ